MILVTGGTGLLGSHLLFDLAKNGKMIRAIRRSTSDTGMVKKIFSYYSDKPDALLKNIEWMEADLLDLPALEDSLEDVTEIYHAGAVVSFFPSDYSRMRQVNIKGTENLVNLAIDKKVSKFCHVSSVSTLGRAENDGITDEETHWQHSRKNTRYSIYKYSGEREVWRGMEEGLPAVIVNPSVIIGPGFWDDNSGLFPLVWKGLKYYTTGINGFVDVKDVTGVMIRLMNNNAFGERFILSSENISYQDLFILIAKYLDKPAPRIHVPSPIAHLAWRIEKARTYISRSHPEITRDIALTTTQKYFYSNEKIRKRIGYEFRSVEDAVKDTCSLFLRDITAERGYGNGNTC